MQRHRTSMILLVAIGVAMAVPAVPAVALGARNAPILPRDREGHADVRVNCRGQSHVRSGPRPGQGKWPAPRPLRLCQCPRGMRDDGAVHRSRSRASSGHCPGERGHDRREERSVDVGSLHLYRPHTYRPDHDVDRAG